MEQVINNEVTIYNNAIETFRNGGEILSRNQAVVSKAIAAGNSILVKINGNDGRLTHDLDILCNDYLVKISQRKKELEESRKPVTQMMDTIKKFFTQEEAKLDVKAADTIPYRIQEYRNIYAKEQAELEKKRQEEAQRRAAKERERVQISADIESQLNDYLNTHLLSYKQQMQNGFNAITLENFQEKEQKLGALPCVYRYDHFTAFKPIVKSVLYTEEEKVLIIAEAVEYKYAAFAARFTQEVEELKQQLIDRLPSKKSELESIAAAEKARKEEAVRAAEAERKRREEIAKSEGERKKQLEEQSRIAAEEERRRQELLAAEAKRLEQERLQREQEENARIASEAEEAKRRAEQEIELKKAAGETMALFDQEAMLATDTPTPETRQGFEITVQHHAGYVQIFQFWFDNEGKKLGLDKLGNTKLDQMKSWCEKHAHKTGEIIDSKFLRYEPTYKAVNRKNS